MGRFNRRFSRDINRGIMIKIATHDSATGERSKNVLHALGKVFAQTQTKTIREQYEVGVRYFDIRVDKDLTLCHGLWKANKDLAQIMTEMSRFDEEVYVRVVIERRYSDKVYNELCERIRKTINLRGKGKVKLDYIAHKIPWGVIVAYRAIKVRYAYLSVPSIKEYLTLAHKDWRRYIPIPRILKKVTPVVEPNEHTFTMYDFV